MTTPSIRIVSPDQQDHSFKSTLLTYGLPVFAGLLLGVFIVWILPIIPPVYLLLAVGGLLFSYLLLFRIDVAVILTLFILYETSRLNYLGGGTPFHPNGMLGMAIIAATLFYFVFHRIDSSRLVGVVPFAGFLLVCFFSLFFAGEYLMDGLTIALRLATGLCIYTVLVYKLDSIRMVKWTILAVAGSQVSPMITSLWDLYAGNIPVSEGELARIGTSTVGSFLALIALLALVQFINSGKTSERFLWGGLVGLFATGLFFSFGRAGWIGFAVGLFIMSLLRYRKLLFILPVLLILVVVLIPAIPERFSDISLSSLSDRSSSTLAGRIFVWKGALAIAEEHPLFGVGYGVGRYQVGEALGRYPWMIHNDYISVFLETGLIGLIVFMLWHGQWLISIYKVFRNSKFKFDKVLALGIFAIFAASLVIRFTDNILQDSYKFYYLSALIAVALALPRVRANEEEKTILPPADEKHE